MVSLQYEMQCSADIFYSRAWKGYFRKPFKFPSINDDIIAI